MVKTEFLRIKGLRGADALFLKEIYFRLRGNLI